MRTSRFAEINVNSHPRRKLCYHRDMETTTPPINFTLFATQRVVNVVLSVLVILGLIIGLG